MLNQNRFDFLKQGLVSERGNVWVGLVRRIWLIRVQCEVESHIRRGLRTLKQTVRYFELVEA